LLNVEDVINKLKQIFNVKTDVELSRILGFSDRVVTTWKQRNTLNFEKIIEIAIKENIDLNYLFKSKDNSIKFKNDDFLEEFIFYNLKRTLFKETIFNKLNANIYLLFKIVKEKKDYVNYSRENAKEVLLEIIKNYEIKSILESDSKKENVIKLIEEEMSHLDCYVFLKYFDKFEFAKI
jgi:hypothetical protein